MTYRTYKSPDITAALGTIEGQERYYVYTREGLLVSKWAGVTTAYHALFIERTVTFRYDVTGRLIEEVSRLWNRPADTVSYRYETGRILYAKSYWDNKLVIRRDTLPLDSRGLSRVYPGNYRYGIYDNEGYLMVGNANKQDPQSSRVRLSVSNGNYVNLTDSIAYVGETRIRYLHYVNQPNVLNNVPFYGKQSRQLLAYEVSSNRLSPYYRDGDKYSTRYVYLFDAQGRVRRSIAYGMTLASDWPFVIGGKGISIIDYEYACS